MDQVNFTINFFCCWNVDMKEENMEMENSVISTWNRQLNRIGGRR